VSENIYGVLNIAACDERICALARANRVFRADEKRMRTENTVMDKNKDSAGVIYEIVDCARMCFSSVRNRRSARTAFCPRKKLLDQRNQTMNLPPPAPRQHKHTRSISCEGRWTSGPI